MKDRIAVSVVITAYNHGRYIGKTIKSVLNQSFQDFEIIVLDDGSPDNTREAVSGFKDGRIKYYYQKNSGLPACGRNAGIVLAHGKYIALMDGDDFWHRDKLLKSVKVLDDMPDVALVCHNENIVHGDKVVKQSSYAQHQEDMYSQLLFSGNCLHTSAVIFRREVFFGDGFKFCEDKDLYTVEDYEYWLRLSRKYKFYFMPEVLGSCRITDTGAFQASEGANAANMLKLLDREFAKMTVKTKEAEEKIEKRRSAVMSAAGRLFNHKGNFADSKRWCYEAMKEFPFNYKAYALFLASVFKFKIQYK